MTLHKLKVAALQHEQREDWAAAIELYRQAIREADGGPEAGDPSLYNRVGDLALKAGDEAAACEAWEQAVVRYGDLGFLNSAIALCGKVLRVNPQRLQTFLDLARLHARKRVLYDVRHNLQIFLDQMSVSGRRESARTAVQQLGNEFPGWRELDGLLDELLGREPLSETAPTRGVAPGETQRGLVFLDTAPIEIERASEPLSAADGSTPLPSVVLDVEFEPRPDATPLGGLQTSQVDGAADQSHDAGAPIDGLIGVAQVTRDLAPIAPVAGLQDTMAPQRAPLTPLDGLETSAGEAAVAGEPPGDDADGSVGGDLVFIATDAAAGADDPLGQRVAGHGLLDHGERAAGIAALEQALAGYQEHEEWLHAHRVAGELVLAEPASIARHQTRVEMAARLQDTAQLCEAYADLGDTLVREGSADKAVAVYRRVLELDDTNVRARAALRAMNPTDETESEFIDLGAMLIDDHPRSTRMRTEAPAVDPDEDETFRDALAEFRRALDQNLAFEDHQAHYDLGIAFKEMGLLDEAVTEFQKALRAPEVRLRTSEALGEVFFDQGRPAVAEAVLRGVEGSPEGDAEKIGVLYWLGRSLDAQGKHADAVGYYQRVTAVDVSFRDVVARLSPPGGDSPR